MKTTIIIFGIIILIFFIIQIFAMSSRNKIESYPYKVVKTFDNFEIRDYEASLFTSVKLPTKEYNNASSKGFSILAGYIFGGNQTKEKIAMTSPVAMALEDSIIMMFMVPKALKKDKLPQPNSSDIEFHEEPAKTVAAIRFGGWANTDKIESYKNKLKALLDEKGISYTNHFYYLGYNPPYDIINRRNEIIVELVEDFSAIDNS